jgi:hypothetical protein
MAEGLEYVWAVLSREMELQRRGEVRVEVEVGTELVTSLVESGFLRFVPGDGIRAFYHPVKGDSEPEGVVN